MNAESARQFVDSNILVYAYDKSQGEKHDRAKILLESLWESGLGCISIQVLQEFYVIATKKVSKPLLPEQASQVVRDFSDWTVHRPSIQDLTAAIEISQRNQLSFWDAMIIQSARQAGCSILWSEDLSDKQTYAGIKVINPFNQLTTGL